MEIELLLEGSRCRFDATSFARRSVNPMTVVRRKSGEDKFCNYLISEVLCT